MLLALLLAAAPQAQWLGPPITGPVTRVVTVAPSLTEAVVALGARELLVGVSRFDELPEVAGLTRVGGFVDPSLETIVALKPDVVVVQKSPGNQKPVELLASLGVSVLALPLTTVGDTADALTRLGEVLHREPQARALVDALQTARARARAAAVASGKHPTVLFVYGFSPLVVAGPGSFAHELLEDCGARNVAEAAPTGYPVYSLERAVRLSPDVIVDAADVPEGRAQVEALPPLKKARWVTLPSKDLLHPGPALARSLESLCAALNGPVPANVKGADKKP